MGVYIEGTNKPETDGTMYQISYFTRDGYFITESYPIYRVIDLDLVRCGECIHFHYDKPYIIQGIPVLGHEVCDFWGDGCKTNPNGFCSYGERRE